jgi:hypothetical protein
MGWVFMDLSSEDRDGGDYSMRGIALLAAGNLE